MANRAIWIDSNAQLSLRDIQDTYEPLDDEVLIEVAYSGINPADVKHARFGFNDTVPGYDFAGTVIKTGAARKDQFNTGDQVFGFGAPLLGKPKQYGVHQRYHCARHFIYKVPPTMPMPDASALMVVTHTAADALFNQLEIPLEEANIPLLIWGAAGAVGTAAVQLAKRAGCYPILVTASTKNHETLLDLGATQCFDYRDPNVVSSIRAALAQYTEKPLKHVLDAVVAEAEGEKPSSSALCEAIADEGTRFTSSIPPAKGATQFWRRTFACRNVDVDLRLPDGVVLKHAPNHEWQANIDHATKWAIDNYGAAYRMPKVVVVKGGEEGMKAMQLVANGGASMEKYVIEHPI